MRDIPIPGMSIRHLRSTGPETLAYFLGLFSLPGLLLAAVGVVEALLRRRRALTCFVLPMVLLNLLFYAFYSYVKARYLFVVQLFAVPFMALGMVTVLRLLLTMALRDPSRRKSVARALAPLMTVIVFVVLLRASIGQPERLQVWHVDDLQAAIGPHFGEKAAFVGLRHHREILSYLAAGSFTRLDLGDEFRNTRYVGLVAARGMDHTLKEISAKVLKAAGERDIYVYTPRYPPLLRQWLEMDPEPAVSLASLPVPLERYGEPMREDIFRILPWSHREVRHLLSSFTPGIDHLLILDSGRLWDYPGRTFVRVSAGERALAEDLPNGPGFIALPGDLSGEGGLVINVASDAPLPRWPAAMVVPLNGEFTIPFGMGRDFWYYPHVSRELVNVGPRNEDSFLLFEGGRVRLPSFAGRDREVMAEFRLEYKQEEPERREVRHIVLDGGNGTFKHPLPPWRTQSKVTVSLGRSQGGLALKEVVLKTDLRPQREQRALMKQRLIGKVHYVKLFDVRLYTVPAALPDRVAVDIGSPEDGPFLREGFYRRERQEDGTTLRWSEPSARMRLPLAGRGGGYQVEISCLEARPPGHREEPVFEVNGWRIPPGGVQVREEEGGGKTYGFLLPGDRVKADGKDTLSLTVGGWNPSRDSGAPDDRDLGLLIDRVTAVPAGGDSAGAGVPGRGAPSL